MDRWAAAGGGGVGSRMKAPQLLDIAEKLLEARDLVGSKEYAERAMESDPLLDGADRTLAVADVLLAAQRCRINNHVDWYAVLLLEPSDGGRDVSAVRLQYRRLALLLRPDHRRAYSEAAGEALKFVSDAWAVLSNPTKKELYDKELAIAAAAQLRPNGGSVGGNDRGESTGDKVSVEAEVNADASFWTVCTSCFYVHQYARGYVGRTLLCQNCRKAFQAAELETSPPIVPGSNMYFCAWGLFPLGFPGGPNFGGPVNCNLVNGSQVGLHAGGKPWGQSFFPRFPSSWGEHGPATPDRRGRWVKAHDRSAGSYKKQKQSYGGASRNREAVSPATQQNQSFWGANNGKADGTTINANDGCDETGGTDLRSEKSTMAMRTKVMAKRPKKPVGGAAECGVTASRAVGKVVNPLNENVGDARECVVMRPDGGHNPQNVGSSRTVEISAEDLDLNFTIDIDATDNILNSLSTLPFLKDGDIVAVD